MDANLPLCDKYSQGTVIAHDTYETKIRQLDNELKILKEEKET
jgi:hypothetical protein